MIFFRINLNFSNLNFARTTGLHLFNPCLSRRFCTFKLLLDCPFLRWVPRNGILIRGSCQKVHVSMNRLYEQTRFFWISSIVVSINNFPSAQNRSKIMFPENILASPTLWTDIAKIRKCSDFSWKTNLLKNHWLHFIQQCFSGLFLMLVWTYVKVNCCVRFLATEIILAEKAKSCVFVWFVFNSRIWLFSKLLAESRC